VRRGESLQASQRLGVDRQRPRREAALHLQMHQVALNVLIQSSSGGADAPWPEGRGAGRRAAVISPAAAVSGRRWRFRNARQEFGAQSAL